MISDPIEMVGVLVSALAIALTARRKMACWPVGLVSVALYGWIFYDARLYSDMLLQGAFAVMQLYGWWRWMTPNGAGAARGAPAPVRIRAAAWRALLPGLVAGALGSVLLGGAMARYTDAALPWVDATLSAFSLVAQYWTARKYVASWALWTVVDCFYVGLFVFKDLYPTSALYAFFVFLAVTGWRDWRRTLARQDADTRADGGSEAGAEAGGEAQAAGGSRVGRDGAVGRAADAALDAGAAIGGGLSGSAVGPAPGALAAASDPVTVSTSSRAVSPQEAMPAAAGARTERAGGSGGFGDPGGPGDATRAAAAAPAAADGAVGQFGVHGEQAERDWPLMTLDEVARVLASYSLDGAVAALSWHSPRPFAAAVLATLSDGRTLFVKRHDARLRDAVALAEEHRFIAHLGGRGIPVAEVLSDRQGRTAIAVGAWVYEVHRSADGLDAYRCVMSWEPFKAMSHAYAAGRALARLHRASAGFPAPARPPRLLLSSFQVIGAPDLPSAAQAWVAAQPLLARALAKRPWRDDLARVIGPYHARLVPLLPSLPALWTHGDWHASNLLWSPEGEPVKVRSVLDFGLADRTCAVYDLALAIERNTIEWLVEPERRRVHADQIDALLDGYASVAPLDAADYRALVALLPIVHTEFALSEVAYFDGILDLPEAAEAAYTSYLLGHALWFGEPAGRALLAQLARRGHVLETPGR